MTLNTHILECLQPTLRLKLYESVVFTVYNIEINVFYRYPKQFRSSFNLYTLKKFHLCYDNI